jgi:hypothetical protein
MVGSMLPAFHFSAMAILTKIKIVTLQAVESFASDRFTLAAVAEVAEVNITF